MRVCLRLGTLLMAVTFSASIHALDPQKLISQFTHTSWSAKDGIPGPVRAIAQTPDGYLWLGTEAGLYRFDGIRFVLWESRFGERLAGSSIWSLLSAHDGSLWIGFGSGGMSHLRDGRLQNYSPNESVPSGGVLSIVEDANGHIWAGGQYGFSKFTDGKWRRIGAELGYPAPGAQALFVDTYGTLWAATDGLNFDLSDDPTRRNTILSLEANGQRFTATGEAIGMVWTMTGTPNGEVWIADTTGRTVRAIAGNIGSKTEIPVGDEPMCLLFDSSRSLWVGLIERGLGRTTDAGQSEHSGLDHFQVSDGLSGGLVYSTFKDREGNIWFGTAGGLDRFRENKVTPFSAREGLDPDQQIALTSTPDGSVWIISYTRDSVRRFYHGRFVTSKLPFYSTSDSTRILSLSADGSNAWVGGSFKLAKEVNGKFSYVQMGAFDARADIEAIAHDAAGGLWISITGWGAELGVPKVMRVLGDEWTDFGSNASLPKYRSRAMYGDGRGRVWLGFEDGEVAVYENDKFHVYSANDGLPSGRIFAITSDRADNIWIGGEGGLSRFHQGRLGTVTRANGLPGNSVSGIIEDDDGSLWLACGLGIFRVSQRELEKALAVPSYRMEGMTITATDGLRGLPRQREPFPTATRAADGRLWFATTAGIAVIDPKQLPKNLLAPPVTIEAIKADGRVIATAPGVRLPPNTRELEFEFAGLSLTDPERVQFRYKLEGYDNDWQGPVSTRRVRYTNLLPANFRFRIIASNNDGVWNETGASWNFSLAPAVYQTIWFRAAILFWVAAFFFFLYKIRIRRITRHNIALTHEITERKRTEALLAGEKRLLEMIATGGALKEILNVLCLIIEEYRSGTLASVLLLRPDGLHLDSVAGPSLPKGWTQQMEKLPIGPCAGSCGTAAYRGSPVIVSDIATDPLWEVPEHRAAALKHGLRASWSNPVRSSDGKVLGTFCMYDRETRSPSPQDLGLIEKATDLARVAIERDRAEAALRTSEEKYRDLINASPDAICVIDADGKCVLVNPAGVKLAERSEDELIGSSIANTYLPEERHLLAYRLEELKAEGSFRFERKFLRKNGEVIPVEVSLSALRGRYYQAIIRDISQRKRREALLAGENRVLEMVAKGDSLADILDKLCLLVEEQSSGVLASILLMDPNGKQLRHGAAPNLPKTYTEAINGAFIGPAVGSCGTAAHRAEQVIVSDIAIDPLWV